MPRTIQLPNPEEAHVEMGRTYSTMMPVQNKTMVKSVAAPLLATLGHATKIQEIRHGLTLCYELDDLFVKESEVVECRGPG